VKFSWAGLFSLLSVLLMPSQAVPAGPMDSRMLLAAEYGSEDEEEDGPSASPQERLDNLRGWLKQRKQERQGADPASDEAQDDAAPERSTYSDGWDQEGGYTRAHYRRHHYHRAHWRGHRHRRHHGHGRRHYRHAGHRQGSGHHHAHAGHRHASGRHHARPAEHVRHLRADSRRRLKSAHPAKQRSARGSHASRKHPIHASAMAHARPAKAHRQAMPPRRGSRKSRR